MWYLGVLGERVQGETLLHVPEADGRVEGCAGKQGRLLGIATRVGRPLDGVDLLVVRLQVVAQALRKRPNFEAHVIGARGEQLSVCVAVPLKSERKS